MATVSRQLVEAAEQLVRRRTGLVLAEARLAALEDGLVRGMTRAQLSDPDRYLARLEVESALLDDLVAQVTVGESYFFREPDQFRVIRDRIVPALLADGGPGRALRLWSAGCAAGEEPYTLSIVMRELGLDRAARIVATDLSRPALAQAHRGRYTRWALRGVDEGVIRRYFVSAGDRFSLIPAVRGTVDFRYLNLAEDSYPSLASGIWGMDLILCRNVLIYFDAGTVKRVAQRLLDALSGRGWLLLGASDPPLMQVVPCEVVVTDAGLAYCRPGVNATRLVSDPTVAATAPPPPLDDRLLCTAPASATDLSFEAPAVAPAEDSRTAAPISPVNRDADEAARRYAAADYTGAGELAARAVERDSSDPAPWVVLIRALANRGDLPAAGRACAAAVDRHRTSAELAYLHAVLLSEAGRHGDAVTAARRALYLERGLVVAHLALGAALARSDEPEAAGRAFRNAESLLRAMPPDAAVPGADGQPAGRLAEMARLQRELLPEASA